MPKAMIFSVGGSPEPIVKSINKHKPNFVCFFVSKESRVNIKNIVAQIDKSQSNFSYSEVMVENEENLVNCYEVAVKAIQIFQAKGYRSADTLIDLTGGTKPMSAGLVLAGSSKGFTFCYVGGKDRDKEGLGVVISGTETFLQLPDPLAVFAVEERKRIASLFNTFQFAAASVICKELSSKEDSAAIFYKRMARIIEGFDNWDRFLHQRAAGSFKDEVLIKLADSSDSLCSRLACETRQLMPRLEEICRTGGQASRSLIIDLLSNADRRFREGKIPDAVIRLYRTLELLVRERLLSKYGIDTNDINVDILPSKARAYFLNKQGLREKIDTGFTGACVILKHLNDELARIVLKHDPVFWEFRESRNDSFLTHGNCSASESKYEVYRTVVCELGNIKETELIVFPRLEL